MVGNGFSEKLIQTWTVYPFEPEIQERSPHESALTYDSLKEDILGV